MTRKLSGHPSTLRTMSHDGLLRPLFRWPGGKRWLVPALTELMPRSYGRYIEPFFGAGALFFALQPSNAVISDANPELMHCYKVLRDSPDELTAALQKLPRDAASYYRIRGEQATGAVESAARFIYLTTLAFNGIYRVNRAGQFNVPYGGRQYGDLANGGRLGLYSEALTAAEIRTGDFESVLEEAGSGDVVYLDPPYTVAHAHNGFLKYNRHLFSWDDQKRLASRASDLDRRGCVVIVSNARHDSIRDLYEGFRHLAVSRHSVMAADARHRNRIEEYLITNAN